MGAASCTPTPKSCSGTCSVQESAPTKGGDLHIAVEGSCTKEDVTAATFDIKMIFGGLPVLSKKGNDATKDNNFKLPLNMGSVTIPAVQLPVKAGSKIEIPTVAHVGKLAPSGKLVCKVDAYDQPAVETGKQATFGLMGRAGYEQHREAVDGALAKTGYVI